MQKESSNKLHCTKGHMFMSVIILVILVTKCDRTTIYRNKSVVVDGNFMCVISKILYNMMSFLKRLLAIDNPVLFIQSNEHVDEKINFVPKYVRP